MLQGLMAGWIFILLMTVLFFDENLFHAIPNVLNGFLTVVVVTMPIWVSIVLYITHKENKAKKQAVEINVVE